jgi:hypothetical protein
MILGGFEMDQSKIDRMRELYEELNKPRKAPTLCLPFGEQSRLKVLEDEYKRLYAEFALEPTNLGEFEIVRKVAYVLRNGEEIKPSMYSKDKRPMRVEYDKDGVPVKGYTTTSKDFNAPVQAFLTFKLVTEFTKTNQKNVVHSDTKFQEGIECPQCKRTVSPERIECQYCGLKLKGTDNVRGLRIG